MSSQGKQRLLDAIAAGKGFVGFHSATDSFHSKGKGNVNQSKEDIDPYIAMLGGEFIKHGPQQKATMRVTDRDFPGVRQLGSIYEGLLEFKVRISLETMAVAPMFMARSSSSRRGMS